MGCIIKPKTNTPRPNVLPAPQKPKIKFMEDILVKGNLYLCSRKNILENPQYFQDDGITIYVKENVVFCNSDTNISLKQDDRVIEDIFEKYKIKEIIAYSDPEKLQ